MLAMGVLPLTRLNSKPGAELSGDNALVNLNVNNSLLKHAILFQY